jgi:hypothetical protein
MAKQEFSWGVYYYLNARDQGVPDPILRSYQLLFQHWPEKVEQELALLNEMLPKAGKQHLDTLRLKIAEATELTKSNTAEEIAEDTYLDLKLQEIALFQLQILADRKRRATLSQRSTQ